MEGGSHPRPDVGPWVYAPTVLDNVTAAMDVRDAETFGPVVGVMPASRSVQGSSSWMIANSARRLHRSMPCSTLCTVGRGGFGEKPICQVRVGPAAAASPPEPHASMGAAATEAAAASSRRRCTSIESSGRRCMLMCL